MTTRLMSPKPACPLLKAKDLLVVTNREPPQNWRWDLLHPASWGFHAPFHPESPLQKTNFRKRSGLEVGREVQKGAMFDKRVLGGVLDSCNKTVGIASFWPHPQILHPHTRIDLHTQKHLHPYNTHTNTHTSTLYTCIDYRHVHPPMRIHLHTVHFGFFSVKCCVRAHLSTWRASGIRTIKVFRWTRCLWGPSDRTLGGAVAAPTLECWAFAPMNKGIYCTRLLCFYFFVANELVTYKSDAQKQAAALRHQGC